MKAFGFNTASFGIKGIIGLAVCAVLAIAILEKCSRQAESPEDLVRYQEGREMVQSLTVALGEYQNTMGKLPPNLKALVPKYIKVIPHDPWGHQYVYDKWDDRAFIHFYGRDGRSKGYGVDLDIIGTVWANKKGH